MSRKKTNIIEEEILEPMEKLKRYVPKNCLDGIKLTKKQRDLITMIDSNDINTIIGPAGTSKTFITCYYALKALRDNTHHKIILTKPIQEAGEKLGSLPGSVEEKIDPFYNSFFTNFEKIAGKATMNRLFEKGIIETRPLAYMRGATFDNAICILDEAQNANIKQIMLFITRMGKDTKVIVSGDIRQYDINKNNVALPFFIEHVLNDITGIGNFEFCDDDIMRNSILIEITKRYELLKNSEKIPKNLL